MVVLLAVNTVTAYSTWHLWRAFRNIAGAVTKLATEAAAEASS